VISRMNYIRMLACPYALVCRPDGNSPVYPTIQAAYAATLPADLLAAVPDSAAMAALAKPYPFNGENDIGANGMANYQRGSIGYVANMQPGLAYAATHNMVGGRDMWSKYQGRAVKQADYDQMPEFAIEPRD
jgi:hypothetical protein